MECYHKGETIYRSPETAPIKGRRGRVLKRPTRTERNTEVTTLPRKGLLSGPGLVGPSGLLLSRDTS